MKTLAKIIYYTFAWGFAGSMLCVLIVGIRYLCLTLTLKEAAQLAAIAVGILAFSALMAWAELRKDRP